MAARVTITKLGNGRWEVKCHEPRCSYKVVVKMWHIAGSARLAHQLSHRG